MASDTEHEADSETEGRAAALVDDPERDTKTQAKFVMPKRPKAADRAREEKTAPRAKMPARGGTSEQEYRTGSNYGVPSGELELEEEVAGSMSLDGDGLEALDPEVGSKTRTIKVDALADEEGDDEGSPDPMPDDDEGADDANATNAGPPIKLEIIAGPDAGKKRRFRGVRMVIGRTSGVDLQLSDQSVSRRHIELIHGDGGVLLRDLGSGNGSKVNGVKVAEKQLEHGDEILIGKTTLRYVDEVAAFNKAREAAEQREAEEKAAAEKAAQAEAEAPEAEAPEDEKTNPESKPRDRSKPVRPNRGAGAPTGLKALPPKARVALVAFVSLVLLIIVMGLAFKADPPPPPDPNKAIADQKMQDARNAVKQADYEGAAHLIEEAERLVPGIDKAKMANQVREELTASRQLDDVRRAITEKRFDDARKAFAQLGKGSVKVEEAKDKLKGELEAAEVAYKKEKIDEFLAAGDGVAAKQVAASLPPGQGAEVTAKIAEFEKHLDEQNKKDAVEQAHAVAAATATKKARREDEIAEAFSTVERKFAGGEWERAASECNRVIDAYPTDTEIKARARALQTTIPAFGRAYDEGTKKHRQGALAQSSKPLRQAWQLYTQLGLKQNKLGAELEAKLGEASLAAGRDALLHDDLIGAYVNFRDATRFDPGDSKARQGLIEVESKAEELFQFAYTQKDRDPKDALRQFKIVVQVTDPSSSIHEKAKNHIAALQP